MDSKTIHSTYKGYNVDLKQTCSGKDCRYSFKISHDQLPVEIVPQRLFDDKLQCIDRIILLIEEHIISRKIEKAH